MTKQELIEQIREKRSFLCVGLDVDLNKMPKHLFEESDDPVFEFNRAIIDATHHYAVAYKPNLAFYEALGARGWVSLEKTVRYLRSLDPRLFIIADAKRGDIGNTGKLYARSFFEHLDVDAVTVAPYMGKDSVEPFLGYEGKWVVLLALTSNPGSADFQMIEDREGEPLYQRVIRTSSSWAGPDEMMYVVGATKADMLDDVRRVAPRNFLLVPGVGAQGGSLEEVCRHGFVEKECGLLINSSRGIIFASQGYDFAEAAQAEAGRLQNAMNKQLLAHGM